jgi:hypothetical protein
MKPILRRVIRRVVGQAVVDALNPFANVERLINQGAETLLANAVARLRDGTPFGVIFDRNPADPLGLVESAGLVAGFELRHAPDLRQDDVLEIDGQRYQVVGGLEPDSSGWVEVQLRDA